MTELEERIIAFVVKETGVQANHVQLDSSLGDDIGMDGDDAVEFFQKFGTKFQVDLGGLYEHWHQHFGPEGGGPSLGCVVVIVVAVVASSLLHDAFKRIPIWLSTIVLIGVFGWVYNKFVAEPQEVSVTVRDLVDAATSGRWVKHYDEAEGGLSPR
jgi:hypothetical protein